MALFLVSAYFYGFSFVDYAIERKRFNVKQSVRYVNKNVGIVTGVGVIFAFSLMVPWFSIIACSFVSILSVIAGTVAVHQVTQKETEKIELKKYLKKTQNIDIDENSIFDIQIKRLHEYKRQYMNALYVIYKYLQIKKGNTPTTPITIIFGAKAAPAYTIAKDIIHLILCLQQLIDNDEEVNKYLKVVMVENYNVTAAEKLIPACDISEQISLASKEASGTGNMKFMLNGALTLGTMDGANVEIVDEVGEENAFIFGLSSDEVINNGGYNPMDIFNSDMDIRKVLMQLINGFYSPDDPERFRPIYNSLLNTQETDVADRYFILKDFKSYAAAQKRVEEAYRNEEGWAKSAMLNVANVGKFTSDRTIEEYVQDIWHLEKVKVKMDV